MEIKIQKKIEMQINGGKEKFCKKIMLYFLEAPKKHFRNYFSIKKVSLFVVTRMKENGSSWKTF